MVEVTNFVGSSTAPTFPVMKMEMPDMTDFLNNSKKEATSNPKLQQIIQKCKLKYQQQKHKYKKPPH